MLERKHHNVEQRSEEWFNLRLPRFTSSNIDSLLLNGRGKDEIGLGFYTYIYETVENELYGEEDLFDNFDMQRGRELEPIAFQYYKEKMAMDFIEVTDCGFFTFGDHEGSSPDALIGDDTVGEIKAPKRRKFFDIVKKGIAAVDKKWQIQIQHQMRVTGRYKGVFIFIYLTPENDILLHTIEVDRDEAIQEQFEKRLPIAIKEKEDYKQYLINKEWK